MRNRTVQRRTAQSRRHGRRIPPRMRPSRQSRCCERHLNVPKRSAATRLSSMWRKSSRGRYTVPHREYIPQTATGQTARTTLTQRIPTTAISRCCCATPRASKICAGRSRERSILHTAGSRTATPTEHTTIRTMHTTIRTTTRTMRMTRTANTATKQTRQRGEVPNMSVRATPTATAPTAVS